MKPEMQCSFCGGSEFDLHVEPNNFHLAEYTQPDEYERKCKKCVAKYETFSTTHLTSVHEKLFSCVEASP